jgi:hypothetical protein
MKAALIIVLLSFVTVANALTLDFSFVQNNWSIESYASIRHEDTGNPVVADWYLDGVKQSWFTTQWSFVGLFPEWFVGTHTVEGIFGSQTFTRQFTVAQPSGPMPTVVPDTGATAFLLGSTFVIILAIRRHRYST